MLDRGLLMGDPIYHINTMINTVQGTLTDYKLILPKDVKTRSEKQTERY